MSIHYDPKRKKPYYVKYKNKTYRGFKNKKEASLFESKLIIEEENKVPIHINFETLKDEYLNHAKKNVAYGTYQKYVTILNDIVMPIIENKPVTEYTQRDCMNFRDKVYDMDYSTTHKNGIIQRYKSVFAYGCKYYGIPNNPSSCLDKFKKKFEEQQEEYNRQFNVWTYDEFYKFLNYVDDYKYKVFFSTLYFTGMRLGECLALTWNDLSGNKISINKNLTRKTDKGKYEIKAPKTKSSMRTITINQNIKCILEEYKSKELEVYGFSENWFVFGRIKPLSQTTIDRIKEDAIDRSGVKRIRLHDLRHSFATNLINSGVNIVAVSKTLGHSNITQTLNTYTHLLEKTNDEMIEKLDANSSNLLQIFSNSIKKAD